ncbi:hypothetical protein R1sor_023999 [Riccia sorocarpa]|uniref:Uncharacterized protein n=1 Tax=Riccia sorocarpa TaxID=122646 RepID=A0ABD3GPE6_9MARC
MRAQLIQNFVVTELRESQSVIHGYTSGRSSSKREGCFRKRKARYNETVSNRNAEATRAREILEVELSRMKEDAVRESSLIREQAIEEARQIRNHAMVESEAIFRNALMRLGNGIMQRRSHDLLDQAKLTTQELVREAHMEANALIEEAKAASLEAESSAADIVVHAKSRAGEIETQALQNARDKEETVPDLALKTRTRRERDAARKRAKYWRQKELEMQLGLGYERVSSVRRVRTARGVASELVKLFHKRVDRFSISTKKIICAPIVEESSACVIGLP